MPTGPHWSQETGEACGLTGQARSMETKGSPGEPRCGATAPGPVSGTPGLRSHPARRAVHTAFLGTPPGCHQAPATPGPTPVGPPSPTDLGTSRTWTSRMQTKMRPAQAK